MKNQAKAAGIGGAIGKKGNMRQWRRKKYFLLILPFLIFIFAIYYVPLMGWVYAFCDFKPGMPWYVLDWVGLKHFKRLLADANVIRVLRNTLVLGCMGIAVSPMPMIFAIFFNEIRGARTKKIFQTITTMPYFISWIIVFGLAQSLFGASGLLNQIIKLLGGSAFPFGLIGAKEHTWVFQAFLTLWKHLGWDTIIYMAAITGIDQEMYDAAKVDGANKVQLIRFITLPGIAPTYLVLLLLKVSNILSQGFDQFYQFFNSLVADKIEILDYYIYKTGFGQSQYSYAIAVGMLKSLMAIVLLFSVNAIAKKIRGSSIV